MRNVTSEITCVYAYRRKKTVYTQNMLKFTKNTRGM